MAIEVLGRRGSLDKSFARSFARSADQSVDCDLLAGGCYCFAVSVVPHRDRDGFVTEPAAIRCGFWFACIDAVALVPRSPCGTTSGSLAACTAA
jgi:hypothetical protein